jgi:hypothetical protein
MNLSVRCRKGRKAQTLYVVVYCAVLFWTGLYVSLCGRWRISDFIYFTVMSAVKANESESRRSPPRGRHSLVVGAPTYSATGRHRAPMGRKRSFKLEGLNPLVG